MPPPTNTDQLTNQFDHRVLRVRENGGPANDIVPTESTTNQRRRTSVALALGDAHPRAELEASRRQFVDYDGLSWPSMSSVWVALRRFGMLANGELQVRARWKGWKLRQLRQKLGLRSCLERGFPIN